MFTVCPKCALTLVVTAADLRVAQGYVRCGRCSSVFNALARLSDERQGAAPGGEPVTESAPQPVPPTQESRADLSPLEEALAQPEEAAPPGGEEEAIPEDALEFDPETTDLGAVFVAPPPNPQWTAATGSFKAMKAASEEQRVEEFPASAPEDTQVDVEIDATFLGEMLREPAAEPETPPQRSPPAPPPAQTSAKTSGESAPDRTAPERAAPQRAAPAAATQRSALPGASPRATARHAAPHARPPAEASRAPAAAAHTARPPAVPDRETAAFRVHEETLSTPLDGGAEATALTADGTAEQVRLPVRVRPHLWGAGAAVALLVLLAQVVNHYRDELAATARFNRPLTALYGSLGVQLVPRWDLRAYDVRQLGASADPAGTGLITVRASIKNAGPQPQPLPLLRVTLQDRFGNRIAARDVAPRFYVPRTIPDSSYLAAGQRIDAEMGFVDPGANAVGFEIDACLPARGGGVTCANDLAPR